MSNVRTVTREIEIAVLLAYVAQLLRERAHK